MSAPTGGPTRRRGPRSGRLSELALEDRPREKLLARGAGALTDEELVAVLLGTGLAGRPVLETARDLLSRGGLAGLYSRGERDLVENVRGIGDAKAARLVAAVEVARRLQKRELARKVVIEAPEAAAAYLAAALAREAQEVVGVLLLDAKNRLIDDVVVFRGTLTFTAVAPGPLFRLAVLRGAVGLVLYHNHPSGDPLPSADDRETTRRLSAAGRHLGIEVRDHLVVGRGAFFSFLREGLLTG